MAEPSVVATYHQRSKHQLQRYAAGPETLDWDAQPNPFRVWSGASLLRLPLSAHDLKPRWADLAPPGCIAPVALGQRAVAALLELCLGLTAWKQLGPDRWALRANPSSGNLHPIEGYVVARGVPCLPDGVHHYDPRDHALAHRHVWSASSEGDVPALWVAFSVIQWREAWKYGERAFRYCELDAGHALGALRYAAAALGWQVCPLPEGGDQAVAQLLGLDRDADFGLAEREVPVMLCRVGPSSADTETWPSAMPGEWHGQANRLDRHPMYRWPVIDEVTQATARPGSVAVVTPWKAAVRQGDAAHARRADLSLSTLIQGRRSAQQFDRRATMPLDVFCRLVAALTPEAGVPWDAWREPIRVHPVVFAHRVEGLSPGVYALVRDPAALASLQSGLGANLAWTPVLEVSGDLPLWRLADHPALAGTLRTLSCHQAIASDACVAVSMLAAWPEDAGSEPWVYRSVLREAGLMGQVLYLQAEAEGFRGTGIGCYFDDAVHELLGRRDAAWQVMYHFTVGVPLTDSRMVTEPPYAHRPPLADDA